MAIKQCRCKSEYQDSKYGAQNRVHNPGKSKVMSDKVSWVCTVCGNRKDK